VDPKVIDHFQIPTPKREVHGSPMKVIPGIDACSGIDQKSDYLKQILIDCEMKSRHSVRVFAIDWGTLRYQICQEIGAL
jgi:hypothetical protein